jgi:gas vesicle protein
MLAQIFQSFGVDSINKHTKLFFMKNSGNAFFGILAAATAGVVIGMLIAPEKGEDLRRNIKDSAGDLTKKLGDLIAEGKEQLQGLKSMFGNAATELQSDSQPTESYTNESYTNGKA